MSFFVLFRDVYNVSYADKRKAVPMFFTCEKWVDGKCPYHLSICRRSCWQLLWIIVSFLVINIGIFLFSWQRTKGVNLQSSDGYFLGGRSLTELYIGSSLLLTNLSTEQMVGLNGQSYAGSMTAMSWEASAPLALIFLALVFLPRYLKTGITTIPDFLEQRFDQRTRQIVSVLLIIGYAVSFLPTVLYSGALVLNQVFRITETFGISTFMAVC